ncbi:hypothetical protein ANN_00095 [Periplaneta americana]|uniref:Uncharacterized protein n=1 Tax=Periplaneta americana TaxID=6978 RepID=A0ABQ8TPW0_PERAM|nr:hypothetical protein ANN_00095 [Periplaneta americana]
MPEGPSVEIYLWILQDVSANIRLYENEQDLFHAVVSVSERMFTNDKPVAIFVPITNVTNYELQDAEIPDFNFFQTKTVAIAENSVCKANMTSLDIIRCSLTFLLRTFAQILNLTFYFDWIYGLGDLLRTLHELGRWSLLISPITSNSTSWRYEVYQNYVFTVNYENNDLARLEDDMEGLIGFQIFATLQNTRGHFIVVVMGSSGTQEVASRIFRLLFNKKYYDSAVILRAPDAWMSVKDPNSYDGTVHCLLNTWCSFLGIAIDKMPQCAPLRMFFLSWILYSICINTVFQAFMISYMVDPGKQHQIDTIQEVLEENYTLLFDDLDTYLVYVSSYDIEDKSYFTQSPFDALNVAFHTEHLAVLINEDFFNYYSKKLCRTEQPPAYHKFSDVDILFVEGVNILLQYLHAVEQWPILVSPTTTLPTRGEYENFIFTVNYKNNDLSNLQLEINNQIKFQVVNRLQNPTGHFIVVVMGDPGMEEVAKKVFECFFRINYFDSVVILREPEVLIGIWIQDNEGGRFIENDKFNKQLIEKNFSSCCFGVESSYSDPFVILNHMDRYSTKVEGLDAILLEMFKNLVGVSNKNCEEDTVLIMITNNMADLFIETIHFHLTTPYFTRSYKFFVPVAQMYPRWASLVRVFTPFVWVSILGSIVSTSLVVRVMIEWMSVKDPNSYDGTLHCFLNTWCAILGVGVDKMPHSTSLRMHFLSWIIYSICVNAVFQAFFTSYMVDPGRQHQIDTLHEILDHNYTILTEDIHILLAYSSMYDIENRSYFALSSAEALKVAFLSEDAAVVINEDFFTYYSKKLCGPTEPPVYHKFSGEAVQMHVQMIIPGSRYLCSKLNQLLGRLVQAGIPRKLMKDITDPLGQLNINRASVDLREEYVTMTLGIVQSPFIFLFLGLLLSIVVFLVYTFKNIFWTFSESLLKGDMARCVYIYVQYLIISTLIVCKKNITWICLWMLQDISANIILPESHLDMSQAVISVSERMFTNEQPVVIYVPVKFEVHVTSPGQEESKNVSPQFKTVTFAQNSLCNTNKTSHYLRSYTEGVKDLLHTMHEFGRWPLLLSPVTYNSTSWRNEVYQNFILIVDYVNNDLRKLENDIDLLKKFQTFTKLHNSRGYFIVVVMGNSGKQEVARTIFKHLFQRNYFDSALIMREAHGEEYNACSSVLCNFLHSPVTSSRLAPNIFLSTLFSNTLNLCSSQSIIIIIIIIIITLSHGLLFNIPHNKAQPT